MFRDWPDARVSSPIVTRARPAASYLNDVFTRLVEYPYAGTKERDLTLP